MSGTGQPFKAAQKRLRATHTKSRRGCYTCKSRRVKCDEVKPICGACALRGESCGFPRDESRPPRREREGPPGRQQPRAVYYDASPHALEFDLPPGPALHGQPSAGPQSLNMFDLQLLSHFMVHTSKNMSLVSPRQAVWQTVVPSLAARNEFLMHLLLALAGLDYLHPDRAGRTNASQDDPSTAAAMEQHLQTVVGHHQRGLQGFRSQLSALSPSNCHEVFAGSLLLVGFAFASLRVRNWSDSHLALVAPLLTPRLDWMYLIRGLTAVVRECWPTLRMGPLRELLQYPGATEDWKMYPDAMFTSIAPPRACSPRISRFCQGAYNALCNLKVLAGSTPSPMMDDDQEGLSPQDAVLVAAKDGLDLLESIYMRILYVLQYTRDDEGIRTSLELQADMENAAVMGWPQALSAEFLATLRDFNEAPDLSLVILGHFYLALALFEGVWFLNHAFDEDIGKIYTLVQANGDGQHVSLMGWPVSVLGV
ncbi:hypothetical protein BJY01DRAFT_226796 [Aspergillus pseudoustus]|uniref:Zn(2)-C6 fungal-type domain-containing protein n=1 Tax=Aspergillus pseudoustus TaxID=1810923 RepID=A0ABR4IVV7_9EURO